MNEKVFALSNIILAIPLVVTGFFIFLSLLAFVKKQHFAVCILPLVIAIVPGLIFFPAMYADRVIVSQTQIEQITGIPLHQL